MSEDFSLAFCFSMRMKRGKETVFFLKQERVKPTGRREDTRKCSDLGLNERRQLGCWLFCLLCTMGNYCEFRMGEHRDLCNFDT